MDSTHVVGKRHEDPIPMFVGANVKCKGQARLVQLVVVPSEVLLISFKLKWSSHDVLPFQLQTAN